MVHSLWICPVLTGNSPVSTRLPVSFRISVQEPSMSLCVEERQGINSARQPLNRIVTALSQPDAVWLSGFSVYNARTHAGIQKRGDTKKNSRRIVHVNTMCPGKTMEDKNHGEQKKSVNGNSTFPFLCGFFKMHHEHPVPERSP